MKKKPLENEYKYRREEVIKKRKISIFRLFVLILIIAFSFFVFYKMGSFVFEKFLYKTNGVTINNTDENIRQSIVLEKLSKLDSVPNEEIYFFAKVTNAEELKLQSNFYDGIKNGDHVVMFKTIGYVFDDVNNIIIKKFNLK